MTRAPAPRMLGKSDSGPVAGSSVVVWATGPADVSELPPLTAGKSSLWAEPDSLLDTGARFSEDASFSVFWLVL